MDKYEIERKLADKADKWELHNLQTKNRELEYQINDLNKKIGHLESVQTNRYYTLEKLFNLLAEHPQFSDLQNEFYQLRNNL